MEAFRTSLDPGWRTMSVRLFNVLYWIAAYQLCTSGQLPSLAAIQRLSDRQLLQFRNLGRKTLQELRGLREYPDDWDVWAATVPATWRAL